MAFIKPIINGKGFDFKEAQISEEKRLDIVITVEKFADCFGFTEEETEAAVKKFASYREMDAIKKMYNGYLIGGISLYNPWSIMNVLDSTERIPLKPYWYNTSSDGLLRRQIARKSQGVKDGIGFYRDELMVKMEKEKV